MAKDFNIGSSSEAVNMNIINGDITSKGTKVSLEGHTHSEYLGKTEKASSASSADKLANARTIGISGGATGTATSFDGSSNINIPVTKVDASKLSGTLDNMNSVLTGFNSNTGYAISAKSIVNLPNSRATWHDRFAFLQNTTIESVEVKAPNGAWSQSNTSAQIKRLFDGKENKALNIVSTTEGGKRFVLKDYSLPWSSIQFIEVSFTYTNPFPRTRVIIEYSTDNETWNTRHESTISSGTTTYLFPLSATPSTDEKYIRLSFIKESEIDESNINLSVIKAWTNRKGDQGFGIEYEQPFNWDENRNIFPHTNNARDLGTSSYKWANVYATNFNGKANEADNASKLSAQTQIDGDANLDNFIEANMLKYATFKNSSSSGFAGNDGMVISIPWTSATYGSQIAFDDAQNPRVKVRGKSSTWGGWKELLHEGNLSTFLATVATSGSYNDLSNKPTIPSAVTESTVSGWGFTKNSGTYSKPSGGIPKTDLASAVQTSLGKADTAVQPETGKGLFSGNYNDLTNKPTIPDGATLYHNTGQNTNGAMTQKAVTDALNNRLEYVDYDSGSMTVNVVSNELEAIELAEHGWTSAQLAGKVDKVSGKGLSTNDFNNHYKGIVDFSITRIKVNGVTQVTANNEVDLDLSAYAKTSDLNDNIATLSETISYLSIQTADLTEEEF